MLWSSLYTPQDIKNPDCYTQVIQLLFDIYIGRVRRAHKQMNGIVKAWGHPVIAGPHIPECFVAKPSDIKVRLVEDGKSRDEWRGVSRTRLQKIKEVQMDAEKIQTEAYKDVDDFDLEFARTCRQPQGNQNSVLYLRNKCQEPNEKRDTLTQRGCQQRTQYVDDDSNDMIEDAVESESDEWLPGKNKQVNLSKRKLKTRGDNTQKQVRQNRDCKKVNKGKRLKDNRETMFSEFDAELSVEANTENQTHEGKKETDKTTWIGIERETGLNRLSEQEMSLLPGWKSRSSLPNVSPCLTLRDAYSYKQNDSMIEDKLAEQSLHLHLEVDDSHEQVEVLLSDDEDNPWSTKCYMTPPFVSEDNNKVGYNNNHSEIKSAVARNIISSSSQSSESLLDIHGNLYSTQMSRSGNHLSQDNKSSSSLSQQDVMQDLRCAEVGSRSTVEQSLRNMNRAEVKVQITKDKDETDLDGTKLKSQESSKLELNRGSGNLDNNSNDDNKDDGNKIDHHDVMIEGVEDMVCPVKTLSNTSTFTDNRRKRNLLTSAKADQNFYNLKESVEGQSVEKRQKVTSEQDSVRTRTMRRNRKLITGETSKKGTMEEVDVLVISGADFSADYQMDSSVEMQTSIKQDGAIVLDNMCPICGKSFPANKLEAHASSCGEDVILGTDEIELVRCISCGHRVPHGMLRLHQESCLHGDVPTKRVTRSRRE